MFLIVGFEELPDSDVVADFADDSVTSLGVATQSCAGSSDGEGCSALPHPSQIQKY